MSSLSKWDEVNMDHPAEEIHFEPEVKLETLEMQFAHEVEEEERKWVTSSYDTKQEEDDEEILFETSFDADTPWTIPDEG